jgi:hypothetical protein
VGLAERVSVDFDFRFVCRLSSQPHLNKAMLSVVETNSFRNIVHISLSFIPGNDAAVKVYLAGLVKEFKVSIFSHVR